MLLTPTREMLWAHQGPGPYNRVFQGGTNFRYKRKARRAARDGGWMATEQPLHLCWAWTRSSVQSLLTLFLVPQPPGVCLVPLPLGTWRRLASCSLHRYVLSQWRPPHLDSLIQGLAPRSPGHALLRGLRGASTPALCHSGFLVVVVVVFKTGLSVFLRSASRSRAQAVLPQLPAHPCCPAVQP